MNLSHTPRLAAVILAAALCTGVGGPAAAQEPEVTPNYKGADLRQIVEAVSEVTGKTFIIDPRVKAEVTMLSPVPMSPDAFYEAFLSLLQVYGFVAVPSGNVIKIMPDANARQFPADDLPTHVSEGSDAIVTQVIPVRNVAAAQLVPILRPLVPQYGHLAAHPPSNMLIISDRAGNVNRLARIIERIDRGGDDEVDIVQLQHASAGDLVRTMTALLQASRGEGAGAINLVADERTNSVLISGDKNERLKLRSLVLHLDTPLEDGGNTQVRYLNYADATELAGKLVEQAAQQETEAGGEGAAPRPGLPGVHIWADEPTNALIITAGPKPMRSIMQVIDKLDIRRAQVAVEAIIVEVSSDRAADLGVTFAVDGSDNNNIVGVTNFPSAGPGVAQIIGALLADSSNVDPTSAIGEGVSIGAGRFDDGRTQFAILLRALASDGDTNILSTPTIVTMDNEEAEIKVAQEVPFLTGQFTGPGQTIGTVNPFQTIQRQEVGTILKITPQINESNAIRLKIEQESSSLAAGAAGAVDLITNKRTISTSVIVEDGGIIVLGGLISDELRENDARVPGLGRIPIVGNLFRSRSTSKMKTNLMVFIRPKILRDGTQSALETNAKYNYIREQQGLRREDDVQLMPKAKRPLLPPIEEVSQSPEQGLEADDTGITEIPKFQDTVPDGETDGDDETDDAARSGYDGQDDAGPDARDE
ncbi:MAG TPA: type II secretion system secretin GspD [Gammaproteobacteria bacterium]|nr:type II secretion system secretin GspD [Gammaproteobacteria bacterium]